MICNRCGVVNRPGHVACVQCMARLDPSTDGGALYCAGHADALATGRCLTCGKLVCDNCGGVINNRAVYCIDDAAAAMASSLPSSARAKPMPADGATGGKRGMFKKKG